MEGGEDGCNSLRPPDVAATTQTITVDVISLDDYLLKASESRIDFVKLDVEGGERDVLRGASDLLGGPSRPVFLVEVQDIRTRPWGYPAFEVVRLMDQADYQWFLIPRQWRFVAGPGTDQVYDANLVAIPRERAQAGFGKIGRLVEPREMRL